jgi:glycosyltransferase involved in cell wall biosynthesis
MRLLFVTENYPPDRGGMGESCDRIVRGLVRAGVGVDVVHFDRKAGQPKQTPGYLRVPLGDDPAHTINLVWNRLPQAFDLHATTHVVAFGGHLPILSAPAFAAWIARPLLTLVRGNELDAGLFDPRRRPLLDDALLRSAAVCTVTTAQAEKITALHPTVRPHVVGNGIDFDLWQATDGDRARSTAWRAQTVEPSRRTLGIFGHLKAKKGAAFFVDALSRSGLADRFHLLLIGEMDPSLQNALGAHPEIVHTHLGTLDRFDLIPYYLACDLVVIPSHYDGFPNVLIEALALGKPVLASNVGGMRDVLTDSENAFSFAPGDAHACRDAIARAEAATDDDLQRMGASAAALARFRCDAREETRLYLDVLQTIQEDFDAKAADRDRPHPAPRELSSRGR